MEELYILGNGFDLYLGLNTKYSDYFENRKITENFYKNLFNIHLDSTRYIQRDINGNNRFVYKKELLEKNIIELYENTKQNLFYLYLYFLKEKDVLWKNVEKKIIPFINMIKNVEKISLDDVLKKGSENEIYKYYLILKIIINKKMNEKNKIDIFEFGIEQLNLFEKDFGDYIGNLEIEEKNMDKILNIFHSKGRKKVINFNYSLILQKLKEKYKNEQFYRGNLIKERIDSITDIINIHGEFKEPIFGIDKNEIEKNNLDEKFEIFTKTSRILDNNTIKKFELPKLEKLESINFFGHSLSEADYSYFQSLFDYYDIYSSTIKLNFMYFEYDENDLKRVRRETHSEVIKLMNEYGKTLDNKDRGKNLLHKLLIENRIKLINVDEEREIKNNLNISFN